jgi:hypothetical protein
MLKEIALEVAASATLFAVLGQSICFQQCPFDSGHGFIAFLLQRGIQFGVGVSIATHHSPVLTLMHEWGIKG